MELLDLIGVGIGILGLIIFLIQIFASKFKQYRGIKEYKRIREKYTVNKRENAAEEIDAFNDADLIENCTRTPSLISVNEIIGLLIVIIVVVAAAIPVVTSIVDESGINITSIVGSNNIVIELIPFFLGLAALVSLAVMFSKFSQ